MVYLEVNGSANEDQIREVNRHLSNSQANVFVLFYMEGCGPCNETRPEWSKLKNVLSKRLLQHPKVVILSIDKDLFERLRHAGAEPEGFPTMRYITHAGSTVETYEDSNIGRKDRSVDSFVEWIESKTAGLPAAATSSSSRKHKRGGGGRRWSAKYKRSIRCHRPRGFSQRQYCKYGRKSTARRRHHRRS